MRQSGAALLFGAALPNTALKPEVMPFRRRLGVSFLISIGLVGCSKPAPEQQAAASVEPAAVEPPAAPSKPATPLLFIDEVGPRLGNEAANLAEPLGRQKLAEMVAGARGFLSAGDVRLTVDRKAKPEWVSAYLAELGKLGITQVSLRTQSRPDYPLEVVFAPEAKAASAAPCSVVAMITEDRGTAVWKLSGGAAGKRGKGMAGPDLSMTAETIERLWKACKSSGVLVVSGAKGVEWGLVYDLAASAKLIPAIRFDIVVVPEKTPVPGHKVELGS